MHLNSVGTSYCFLLEPNAQIATEDSVSARVSTHSSSVHVGADGIEIALTDALDSGTVISRMGHPVK